MIIPPKKALILGLLSGALAILVKLIVPDNPFSNFMEGFFVAFAIIFIATYFINSSRVRYK